MSCSNDAGTVLAGSDRAYFAACYCPRRLIAICGCAVTLHCNGKATFVPLDVCTAPERCIAVVRSMAAVRMLEQ